ncbi:MAG: MFS transporter [Desulfobacteraceae bacterium]
MGVRNTFRALSSRDYRLFLAGQGISLMGTCFQQTALGWLVYRLTGSSVLLGLVGFCGQIPSLFLAPMGGVLADRICKRKLIVMTQVLSMGQAAILGTLLVTGTIRMWHIPVLSFLLGIVNALDVPVRQSFIVETVRDRTLIGNALSLNSFMVNMARIIAPPLAGFMIASFGEGVCFYINAASFGAVILTVCLMGDIRLRIRTNDAPVFRSLKEGFTYVLGEHEIRSVLVQLGIVSFCGVPFVVLLPVFARDILHGDAGTLGFLMGTSGAGALSGALFLASRKNDSDLERIRALGVVLFGLGLVGFSMSGFFPLSLAMLYLAGFGMIVQMAAGNTLIQNLVDDDKRGRVMSLFTMAVMGMIPMGSLFQGFMANQVGASATLAAGGIGCLLCAVVARMMRMRKAYFEVVFFSFLNKFSASGGPAGGKDRKVKNKDQLWKTGKHITDGAPSARRNAELR